MINCSIYLKKTVFGEESTDNSTLEYLLLCGCLMNGLPLIGAFGWILIFIVVYLDLRKVITFK